MKINYRVCEFILLLIFITGIISCNKIPGNENKNNIGQKISVINPDSFASIIKKRNQKVLFVNVWATWCIPCIEEFPELIKLNEKYSKKDVDIITLNINLLSEMDSKVIPFLKKNKNTIPVFMAENDNIDDLINLLDKNWSGAVPVSFVFNKRGQMFSSVFGKKDYVFFSSLLDSVFSIGQNIK